MKKPHRLLACSPDNHALVMMFATKHKRKLQEATDLLIKTALQNFKPSADLRQEVLRKLRGRERRLRKAIDTVRRD